MRKRVVRVPYGSPPAARFWAYVDKNGPNGCWVWTGTRNEQGYGRFKPYGNRLPSIVAHRWGYLHQHGPVLEGLTLDHLCKNTACVNPDHLEPVTGRENWFRGNAPSRRHADKTHCPRGHAYDYFYRDRNKRACRRCARERLACS